MYICSMKSKGFIRFNPNRQELLDSGFYDGRFKEKKITDKKKHYDKLNCRKRKHKNKQNDD